MSFSSTVIKILFTVPPALSSSMSVVLPKAQTLISKFGLLIQSLESQGVLTVPLFACRAIFHTKNRIEIQIIERESLIIFLITKPRNEVIKKIITIISQKTKKYYPRRD